jgi:hypothetical protein
MGANHRRFLTGLLVAASLLLLSGAVFAQNGYMVADTGYSQGGMPDSCCPTAMGHSAGGLWVRGEYLLWWTKGMWGPPLVTTSDPANTPEAEAGVLGLPRTEILFGGEDLLTDVRSGGRLRVGKWLGSCGVWAIEGDFFTLGDKDDDFRRFSDGDPILARPYYNVLTDAQASELVAYLGRVEGEVAASASTSLTSSGIHVLRSLRSCGGCGNSCLNLLAGYRYLHLDGDVAVSEDLVSTDPLTAGTEFLISDVFDARNDFHGGELGIVWQYDRCRWSLEMLAKVALGNNHQVVRINGGTIRTVDGTADPFVGGILAQSTNIGTYKNDDFAVVPEVGITLGYQLTCRTKLTFGYTFLYLSDVVRPGDQIDTSLNPNLFPPAQDPGGLLRPAFVLADTDFWAQGLSFGVECCW